MKWLLVSVLLVGCVFADDDDVQVLQSFKSVKGGQGGWYNPDAAVARYFRKGYNDTQHGYNLRTNLTAPVDLEVGVCYIEVPTASLAKDTSNIPAGNGSRPDLSRIRSCCKGFIRNIYNFYKCDPVCTQECVNALCTAPETCTCFPDHVKNSAGFCIPTCPIGCQNGRCDGGECLCKDGFKLDSESKYCLPACKENCAGLGNCTAPNTCACKTGYQSTPDGSCKPVCDRCSNGDCVAPNECRCHQGFAKDQQGLCVPHCDFGYQTTPQGCKPICDRCINGDCIAPNDCRCHQGYAKDQQGQCVPHCNQDCRGYRCIAPNVCETPAIPNRPYQPNDTYVVEVLNNPNIHPLQPANRRGDVPDNQGFVDQNQYSESVVPQCSHSCLNGFCVEGNRCACNRGYILDTTDPTGTRCVPNCPGGCPNGVCSSPNFCICNMGYVKDHSVKGRQNCIKRERRSVEQHFKSKQPVNVAELLTFAIPDDF